MSLKPEDLVQNRKYNISGALCNPYTFLALDCDNAAHFLDSNQRLFRLHEEDLSYVTERYELIKRSGEYYVAAKEGIKPHDNCIIGRLTGLCVFNRLFTSLEDAKEGNEKVYPDTKKFRITAEELPMGESK